MTKRQTRAFFYAGTGVFTAIFLALTIDSHRQFPRLTHSDRITADVVAGKHVWHRKNCINCHTLLGEGAYFAPDLTKITQQRGAAYLKAFLKDPSKFYSEERDRRLMPTLNLSDREIDELIAFLDWVSHIDTQGWPPRPILVSGAAIPGTAALGAAPPQPASTDPVALGEALFRRTPPGCFACHSTAPGVNLVGPSLANAATTAAQRVKSPDYHGQAKDAEGYLRESILDPNAYVVQGPTFSSGGRSLMPADFARTLEPRQVDELVAYLMTLK
ncbi:MAG TPA: c-type cytochrome [Longimicrobiales bacterium]|nr:c-type cytochrome [Longimicrobiales bacterium]